LKIKKAKNIYVNEEFYKSKDEYTGGQKNNNKKNFIYELIPSDNYEKNNKKTFSVNPEINLIDKLKIEEILKDSKIPLQEKVKNFDIQYESKIEDYRNLKNENCHFHEKFHKFYKNGDLVEFEPFKAKNENFDQMQKFLEKKIFDEIISAYEKKNYKIPDVIRKNIFEISPMLVDLKRIKTFYKLPERLDDEKFKKDIKKMIKMNSTINNCGLSNVIDNTDYNEKDFILKNNNHNHKDHLVELKLKTFEELKSNLKFKEYIEIQAEELKIILNTNTYIKDIVDEDKNKENNACNFSIYFYSL